ncbi:MAG: nucleoside-diphosphate kinase [Candidatus Omnitrophica bacterium]|nr:nucleoside-diphosphate kinase [Candidatus Omnitrophota bacterium]
MMAPQSTLFLIKPDAVQRGLLGAIISRIEELRLDVLGAKIVRVSKELAEAHYAHIRGKPFFDETVEYLQGKRHGVPYVMALVLSGEKAVERVRALTGATHPEKAAPSSIRGAFGRMATNGLMENVVHASANTADASREIALWFQPHEVLPLPSSTLAAARPPLT